MRIIRKMTRFDWVVMVACSGMLSVAQFVLMPKTAHAQTGTRYCYCNGYECGSPGSTYARWCCNDFPYECGCTFFVTSC